MKGPEVLPVARKALAEVSKIGEVSCCAAWIAERTHGGTVRWLSLYLCLCLSHSLHLSLSVSLSFSPSPSPYFSLSLFIFLSLSLTLFTYGTFSVAISPNLCISFFFVSLFHPIFLSTYLFIFFILLSIPMSVGSNYAKLHFLYEWKLTSPKQRNFVRPAQEIEVHSSKRKKFCKAPSNSQGGQHQKRGISARLPSKMKSLVQS